MPRALRLVPAAVVALAVLSLSAVAIAATVGFFDGEASQEAMLSEMTTHPTSLRVGSVTYLAYQGAGFDPYVIAWDETTRRWWGPFKAGDSPMGLDSHGGPAMFVDSLGRIHLIYGSHSSSMLHAMTAFPHDIEHWTQLPAVDSGTYPQALPGPDGTTRLFYRSRDYGWRMQVADARGEFATQTPEQVLIGGADTWWYADFRNGSDGKVHAAYVWVDNVYRLEVGAWARFDAHYMSREASGTWRNYRGEEVTVPVDHARAETETKVYESGSDLVNEITVKEDDAGAPCIMFVTGSGSGPTSFKWRFMRLEGGEWSSSDITTTDHFFDSGAFDPKPGGGVEAIVVTGDTGGTGVSADYSGRGGTLMRYLSADRGSTWTQDPVPVSPDETSSLFASPHFIRDGSGDARVVFTDWTNDLSDFFRRMFLWGDSGLVTRTVKTAVSRVAGDDRYATSVALSKRAFAERSPTVIIATGKDFPDALTASSLSMALEAPIILSAPESLSSTALTEISRLRASTVILIGGEKALSTNIQTQLARFWHVKSVERIAGADRYSTAEMVAKRLYEETGVFSRVFVVSGANWPDAASVGPLAAYLKVPILLSRPTGLTSRSQILLDKWDAPCVIVGGTGAVPDQVLEQVTVDTRLAGADRYETSGKVAEYGAAFGYLPYRFVIATGRAFPDALSGAPLAARLRGPILLTAPEALSEPARRWAAENAGTTTNVFVLGKEGAVSAEAQYELEALFR